MHSILRHIVISAALSATALVAKAQTPRVGPPHGSVLVVGGGSLGPEVLGRFVELAGGPDALIVDIPTAGGDSVYPADWAGTRSLKAAGAKHVVVLHTTDRKLANSDSFAAILAKAGGVWFEGGRQWHLVDSYAGTKTEKAFHDVLARGGVVGGSSAGASILASYLLRGAREGNTVIMAPGYEQGFGFLRGVGIDQHVVARERLPDIADSLIPKRPDLLGISEDEGTAWLVRGDTAEIIGRNKAFVYGGHDPNDPGRPFLTLYPGDRYDLGARRVLHRANDDSRVSYAFIDSLFTRAAQGHAATVLVAQDGKVLVDRSFGIPAQARYMPTTTVPNFPLGGLSASFDATAALIAARDGKLTLDDPIAPGATTSVRAYITAPTWPDSGHQLADLVAKRTGTPFVQFVTRRLFTPIGAHKTVVAPDGQLQSNVDELYRWELGLEHNPEFSADTVASTDGSADVRQALIRGAGLRAENYRGLTRYSAYGTPAGGRNAFVRIPDRKAVIIILTNDDGIDAKGIANAIADRLLAG